MKKDRSEIRRIVAVELEGRSEIVFAYIFGSFVENKDFKDIDLGVWFLVQPDGDLVQELADALRRSLERRVGLDVDVIPLNAVSDALIYHASRGELILDRDADLRETVITSAWKRYWDFSFKRDTYLRDVAGTAATL